MQLVLLGIFILASLINGVKFEKDSYSEYHAASPIRKLLLGTNKEVINYRLPLDVKPSEYRISLTPYFDELNDNGKDFTFDGRVEIDIRVLKPTDKIYLHRHHLNIMKNKVTVSGSTIAQQNEDNKRQFHIISLSDKLKTNAIHTIAIEFSGQLQDKIRTGFYRGSYKDINGNTRYLGATEFEPTFARKAFPCFDEPGLKAKFKLDFKIRKDYDVISNMPKSNEYKGAKGFKHVSFHSSIEMSTYLVAFVISDFKSYTENSVLPSTIWSQESLIQYAKYGWNVTNHLIAAMEDYVKIKYQLPKIDQAAIPQTISAAMENWGLIAYKDKYLLYQPDDFLTSDKQRIVTTIAHEIGHQWFGNQVTPKWWNHIWLSEGFAKYFEYHTSAQIEPDWRLREQFVVNEMQNVLYKDSYLTRPMNKDAQSPDEIKELFDLITYSKGGSVVRMIEHVLTTEVFLSGLNKYLIDRNLSSAEPSDLWRNFQIAYDESKLTHMGEITVEQLGNSWITQASYPVVNVKVDRNNKQIHISQEIFKKHSILNKNPPVWLIPLNYVTGSNLNFSDTTPTKWLKRFELSFEYSDEEFVIFNKHQTGYYRVNYDDANWNKISTYLLHNDISTIPPVNRAQLLDDALKLAFQGQLSYSIALDVTKYLANETDYIPWAAVQTEFSFLDNLLSESPIREDYVKYQLELIEKVYEKLNGLEETENDSHITRLHRTLIAKRACMLGHEQCRKRVNVILKSMAGLNEINKISPDIQEVVYCGGLRNGDLSDWDMMHQKYFLSTTKNEEKQRILSALGCIEDEHILKKFLNNVVNSDPDTFGRTSDAFRSVYKSGPFGLNVAMNYLENNVALMIQKMKESDIAAILSGISFHVTTMNQMRQFGKIGTIAGKKYEQKIQKGLRNIIGVLIWKKRYESVIRNWLQNKESNGSIKTSSATILYFISLICVYVLQY